MPDVPIGTYEDAVALLGYKTERVKADLPLDIGLLYALSSVLEDDNPAYWDARLSQELWDHRVAPAALLVALFSPLRWRASGAEVATIARTIVPLPGETLINVGTDQFFHRPLRVGDWLSRTETLVDVSPQRNTALGPGNFVTTQMDYFDEQDELVAVGTNVLLRFSMKNGNE